METLEKSISRIMADKVYSSGEFKRERDNFYVSNYEKYYILDVLEFPFSKFPILILLRHSAKILSDQMSRNG